MGKYYLACPRILGACYSQFSSLLFLLLWLVLHSLIRYNSYQCPNLYSLSDQHTDWLVQYIQLVMYGRIPYLNIDWNSQAIHCKGDWDIRLQEIPQLIIIYEIQLQPTSRRFLRELDKAPGGNNLHYILQCLRVPASVTRV